MTRSNAHTVDEYLAELPPERQDAIGEVRKLVLDHLPDGYQECLEFGMISYVVPLNRYPVTYNKRPLMYAELASQKNYMSLYLMNICCDENAQKWFVDQYAASGKQLDMGKSCVRFKNLDDLPMDVIASAIARTTVDGFIELYEASRRQPGA